MNNLRIENPCPVLLSRMTDNGNGTFNCASCHKEVMDFREKTPEEIRSLLDPNGCGIFRADQLAVTPRLSFFRQALFASLTVLSFLGFNVSPVQAAKPSPKDGIAHVSSYRDDKEKDKKKDNKKRKRSRRSDRRVVGKLY